MKYVIKTALEQVDHMLVIETDIHVAPLFACAYDALITQAAQLVGNSRFRQVKTLDHLTYSHFAFHQHGDDGQSGGVAQGIKEGGQVGSSFGRDGGCWHIFYQLNVCLHGRISLMDVCYGMRCFTFAQDIKFRKRVFVFALQKQAIRL